MNEIEESKNRSKEKLASLKEAILTKDTITSHKHFCIYTTGSYGREEAGEYSDIDLFFVSEEPIKKIDKILELKEEVEEIQDEIISFLGTSEEETVKKVLKYTWNMKYLMWTMKIRR